MLAAFNEGSKCSLPGGRLIKSEFTGGVICGAVQTLLRFGRKPYGQNAPADYITMRQVRCILTAVRRPWSETISVHERSMNR